MSMALLSCSLFETRTPEDPSGSTSSFQQPTSELIVISNLQNSVKESNTDNFMRCLADTTQGARRNFHFEPSSEALASYTEQFKVWTLQNERQAFNSMASKVASTTRSELVLSNGRFELRVPDSAVYISDYILRVPHSSASISKIAAGYLRLTIVPNQLNQWSIERWTDAKSGSNDSIPTTWSVLKAQFAN